MCECTAYVAFDKATNGQTGITLEMGKTFSSMSLLKIVGEKSSLPRKDRVWKSVTALSEDNSSEKPAVGYHGHRNKDPPIPLRLS